MSEPAPASDLFDGLAAVIHDLRQPLHALALNTRVLQRRVAGPTADPELPPLADQIAAAAALLEAQFDQLLDLARLLHTAVPVHAEPLPAARLFERLRLQLGPLAFDRGLTLRFRGGHHRLHVDPAVLGRILLNLVANALRYTDDGGVLVACRRVEHGTGGAAQWRLQVWDSGCGIAAEALPRLFEPYFQARPHRAGAATGSAPGAGLGLGLAIARRLADAMDARLGVCSVPGRGTVMTLTWPAASVGR